MNLKYSTLKIGLILFSLITILVNCKKEKPDVCWDGSTHVIEEHSLDTIYPSDYIMAYPGSWWEYDNGFIDTCKGWYAQKTERNEVNGTCTNVMEDLIYVPRTFLGVIHGGAILYPTEDYQETKYSELIDTNKVNSEVSWGWGRYPYGNGYIHDFHRTTTTEIIEHLDSFEVNSTMYYDIIHCQTTDKYNYFKYPSPPVTYNDFYFAKNIGLIQMETYFTSSSIMKLVNHYIAPH